MGATALEKILVVFTGGTIGTRAAGGVLDVDADVGYLLLDEFYRRAEIAVEFETLQPLNILSENLRPAHWETLYNTLAAQDLSGYAGVIITHGTDTLPYSTAAFSYLLRGLGLPVVFVSSNASIGAANSNGVDNFVGAVRFVLNARLPGVFATFRGADRRVVVYLGTRLREADSDDRFTAERGLEFGAIVDGAFARNEDARNVTAAELFAVPRAELLREIRLTREVLCVSPYPGLDYAMFDLETRRPAAVLHRLYHSSTACVEGEEHSLVAFAERCARLGIDLYLYDCGHWTDESVYATGRALMRTGARALTGIAFEAAYAKLVVAYNQGAVAAAEYMRRNVAFEFTGSRDE